jgi:DNA-binding SARP family transcriptional activator/tetratricopeptide (TPR) repeat protein
MRFGLLGPVTAQSAGSAIDLSSPMPRALLAVLLFQANSAVSAERLSDALWGQHPPASAAASLRNHLMRLRRLLGDEGAARIRAVPPGYLIQVEPGELDLHTFTDLCATGRAAAHSGQWAKSSADLAAALALWRVRPTADVSHLDGPPLEVRRLLETRLQVTEERIDADLHLARHERLITELRYLALAHPLREGFHGQLMLALYRAGRRGQALEAFRALRRTLVDELGVEPSLTVQELRRRILDDDPELAVPTPAPTPTPGRESSPVQRADADQGRGRAPFQLPADTRVFTGRGAELDRLTALAREAAQGRDAGPVVISAIDGMAGVGKTALAVRAAHQVRESFPDGQLFLDLDGHTAGLEPLAPADALGLLLRSLGTAPQLIPRGLAERAACYRDRLSGTRTLIILDNASTTAQVRPLLPGDPGCLVLVTSRKRLTGLDDAHLLALDILPEADAAALLHEIAGPGRIPAGHPAAAELLALCGRIPLAIRIMAARLRRRPALRIEELVRRLREEQGRLDHFADEDRSLAAIFESSYEALPEAEQRLFRLLGFVPGPDVDTNATAALLGTDLRTAERLLESLLDHNLLTQHAPGRFRFHDLVRVYARELAAAEPAGVREAALDRLPAYYERTARQADAHLSNHTRPGAPGHGQGRAAEPRGAGPDVSDQAGALVWIRAELDNLLAVAALPESRRATAAAATATEESGPGAGGPRLVGLSAALAAFLHQEGPWPQAATLHEAAAGAARDCGDRQGEAGALADLARVRKLSGDLPAAADLHERALAMYRDLGDRLGEANGLWERGRLRLATGDLPGTLEIQEQALAIYQDLGDRHGEANVLHELGGVHLLLGDASAANDFLERALAIYRESGRRHGEADTLYNLGRVRQMTGEFTAAVGLQERALAVYADLGHRLGMANALFDLGRVQFALGDAPAAAALQERALTLYRRLGSRHGEANALWDLGRVRTTTGDFTGATDVLERALAGYRVLGDRHGEANALFDLGRVHFATGNYPAAADLQRQAQRSYADLGDRWGLANSGHALARMEHLSGDPAAAATLLDQSLAVFREFGDRQGEAEVLNTMGTLAAETTGPREALALHLQSLDLARAVNSLLDEARALEGAARCTARIGDRSIGAARLREAIALFRRVGAAEAVAAEAHLAELEAETEIEAKAAAR